MFGGPVSVGAPADLQSLRDARFVLDLCELITNREEVASEIKRFADEGAAARRALAELREQESSLLRREQAYQAHEAALAKCEQAIAEKERLTAAAAARVEEQKAEIAEVRAELRRVWAA
jgi:hypothetical protein